jgi:hypothetical protein
MPGTAARSKIPRCPRCHARALDERAYCYLLGLYLGDGHITQGRRGDEVFRQLVLARARRTLRGIDEQVAKAEKAVAGKTPVKRNRFIQLSGGTRSINRELEAKARALAGLKGYVTNLRACPDGTPITAEFVIGAYHRLFEIKIT